MKIQNELKINEYHWAIDIIVGIDNKIIHLAIAELNPNLPRFMWFRYLRQHLSLYG